MAVRVASLKYLMFMNCYSSVVGSSQVYTTSKSVVERFDAVGRFRGSFSVFTILMFEKYPIIYKQKDVI